MTAFLLEHHLEGVLTCFAVVVICAGVLGLAAILDLWAEVRRLQRELVIAHNLLFATADEVTDLGGTPFLRAVRQREFQRTVDDVAAPAVGRELSRGAAP